MLVGEPGEVGNIFLPEAEGLGADRIGDEGGGCESAGGGDCIVFGQGDADVEVAVFAVEPALVQVGDGMPSFWVIDGGLRIPLGDLAGPFIIAVSGKGKGQLFVEGGRYRYLSARQKGGR